MSLRTVRIDTPRDTRGNGHCETAPGLLGRYLGTWLRLYLSMKRRVMIANSLMMSIPRYAIRFIELPTPTKKLLEQEYYKFVWNDRSHITDKDFHACCGRKDGGIGCLDLESITNASVIAMVVRTITTPELPWVKLANDLVIQGARPAPSLETLAPALTNCLKS